MQMRLTATTQQFLKIDFVSFLETTFGKITSLCLFMTAIFIMGSNWWPVHSIVSTKYWMLTGIALGLISFFPQQRKLWVGLFSAVGLFVLPWIDWISLTHISRTLSHTSWLYHLSSICSALLICMGYLLLVRKYNRSWLARNALLCYITLIIALMCFAFHAPTTQIKIYLWSLILPLAAFTWYLGYNLLDLKQNTQNKMRPYQMITSLPFWGGTTTPFPKGANYLKQIASKTPSEFAKIQLSGLKLILLTLTWCFTLILINVVTHAMKIPTLPQTLNQIAHGHSSPWHTEWLTLIFHFIGKTLILAINGHIIIGICRMAGFNAAKNMDKPFLAKSISDFWNRYYFYFKELLAELFFYPAYFKFFKNRPKLRLFFATFMSACVGNLIYHFLIMPQFPIQYGVLESLNMMQTYFFYCIVLTFGIYLSQLRAINPKTKRIKSKYRLITTPIIVIGFYCFLSVFNEPYQSMHLINSLHFIAGLFNL